jgi:p24 family protein delta-1
MAARRTWLQYICSLALFIACTNALKFDITAYPQGDKKGERCIRNFVGKDTLVVVTAIVSGYKGDGQQVNIHVRSH